MVLALWYSRAAFGRCYSGATCHKGLGETKLEALESARPARRGVPGGHCVRRNRPPVGWRRTQQATGPLSSPTSLPTVIAAPVTSRSGPRSPRTCSRPRTSRSTPSARPRPSSRPLPLVGQVARKEDHHRRPARGRRLRHLDHRLRRHRRPDDPPRGRHPGRPGQRRRHRHQLGRLRGRDRRLHGRQVPGRHGQSDRRHDHRRTRPERHQRQDADRRHAGAIPPAAAGGGSLPRRRTRLPSGGTKTSLNGQQEIVMVAVAPDPRPSHQVLPARRLDHPWPSARGRTSSTPGRQPARSAALGQRGRASRSRS